MSVLFPDECLCAEDVWSNTFLTSCLLVLVSAVPECHQPPGGSQTLWRTERGDTHSHTAPRKQGSLIPTLAFFCTPSSIHSLIHVSPGGPEPTHRCALCQRWSTFAPSLLNLQTKASTRRFRTGTLRERYGLKEQLWAHRCLCSHSLQPPQRDPAGGSPRHYLRERTGQVSSRLKASALLLNEPHEQNTQNVPVLPASASFLSATVSWCTVTECICYNYDLNNLVMTFQ